MARTQALMIQIATGDSRPISKQIVDAVRMKIATGELTTGAQLPSVRGLAQQLTVNPNTIAKAYAELTISGLVDARQGMGLFVSAPRQMLSKTERNKRLHQAIDRCVNDVMHLQFSDEEIVRTLANELGRIRSTRKAGGQ